MIKIIPEYQMYVRLIYIRWDTYIYTRGIFTVIDTFIYPTVTDTLISINIVLLKYLIAILSSMASDTLVYPNIFWVYDSSNFMFTTEIKAIIDWDMRFPNFTKHFPLYMIKPFYIHSTSAIFIHSTSTCLAKHCLRILVCLILDRIHIVLSTFV